MQGLSASGIDVYSIQMSEIKGFLIDPDSFSPCGTAPLTI
jgi:hypothetical protein